MLTAITRTSRSLVTRDRLSQISTIMAPFSTNNLTIDKLFNVKDKVVLVTGGGTGIGLMCSQAFAANGAKVYIASRNLEKLQRTAEVHGKDIAGQLIPLQLDVGDKSSILGAVEQIKSREGHLDVLVNNSGVSPTEDGPQAANVSGGSEGKPEGKSAEEISSTVIEKASFDQWTDVYRINCASIFMMSMAFLPLLQAGTERTKGWSSAIINITSISGMTKDNQGHMSYNASKAAAIHVTKMISADFGEKNVKVRVNSLAPGVYPSAMTASEYDEENKSKLDDEKFKDLPAGRSGNDADMANGILFMATNQYLNFANVQIDGGYLAQSGMAS